MSITIGFIALFISVVLPGLIFQRFYYFGEFYKQFTTRVPPLRVFVYALIPGLILQISGIYIYHFYFNSAFRKGDILTIFQELLGDSSTTNSLKFMEYEFTTFIIYTLFVYFGSMFFGFILSRMIRFFKWDIRWKLFRFRNEWSYIFSGEIFYFEKFRKNSVTISSPNLKKVSVGMVYADILIGSSEGNQLYSGIVVDYDLKSDDLSRLDKIYLMNAKRYTKGDSSDPGKMPKLLSKPIPGDLFVLSLESLVNINLTYATEPRAPKTIKPTVNQNGDKFQLREIVPFILFFLVLASINPIFFKPELLSFIYVDQMNFLEKLVLILTFNQFLWLFAPPVKKLDRKNLFSVVKRKALVFLLFLIVLIFMYVFRFI